MICLYLKILKNFVRLIFPLDYEVLSIIINSIIFISGSSCSSSCCCCIKRAFGVCRDRLNILFYFYIVDETLSIIVINLD